MGDWIAFWDSEHSIYVNDRHRDVHYRDVALAIRALVPPGGATVVDYGCGEATAADRVAEAAGRLILSDGAPAVREKLSGRFSGNARITVLAPEEIAALPREHRLHRDEFGRPVSRAGCARRSARHLPPPAHRERTLRHRRRHPAAYERGDGSRRAHRPRRRNGFLAPALAGLVRTAFSDYRALRTRLGLAHYTEARCWRNSPARASRQGAHRRISVTISAHDVRRAAEVTLAHAS